MLLYYHKMDEISRLFMKSVRGYNDLLFERGADVEWTVTVSNFGPDVAHDVNVTDLLPVSLEFVSSDGDYVNTYNRLTKIFECPDWLFFEKMAKNKKSK